CNGTAMAAITGGTAPYLYLWDDPASQTNALATGLCAGSYAVTLTDDNGCISSIAVTIGVDPDMIVVISSTSSSCGANNGSASATVSGGVAPLIYLWDDPTAQTTPTATGLAAGFYTVVVTDAGGCVSNATDSVNNTGVPSSVTITSSIDVSCNGGNDGLATAAVTGGTAPYAYLWDDLSAQTNPSATGLIAGIYTVSVSDTAGCLSSATVTVNEPPPLTLTLFSTSSTCGANNGSASATVSGGVAPLSYLWDDPATQTTALASGLAAAVYNFMVTDSNGCTVSQSISVNDVGGATVSIISSSHVTCNGGNDGSALSSSTGGTPPLTYMWDDPSNQNTINAIGLAPGTYTVSITDSLGCTNISDSVIITEPSALLISSTHLDATGGACNGSITATASGGTVPYTFLWDDSLSQTTQTATALCSGSYTVTVIDNNDCVATNADTVSLTTGLAALLEDGDVRIYPNPTEDLIWIDNTKYAGSWGLKLYDFTGKMIIHVANIKTSPFVLDMNPFLPGIYVIKVTDDSGRINVEKILNQ
ncbi:MAG: T9SS type A sorting domain-containing protein, partial [Flavobacteriales bacterium]|nr:T9SS type A sorting domain-containing protein [Flavobacteriales bacterium]